MLPSQETDVSLQKRLYTLQNAQDCLSFSFEHGLVWESWERNEKDLFETPGLVIGPHAGSRAFVREPDPFVNGIGTSAPWECLHADETQLIAQLQGTQKYQNKEGKETTLANLEGQAFTLRAIISLTPEGVLFKLSVCAESDGLIGLRCPVLHDQTEPAKIVRDTPTTGHFSMKGAKNLLTGRITALNPEWNGSTENDQFVICSALYPEKPILTINQIDLLFQIESILIQAESTNFG